MDPLGFALEKFDAVGVADARGRAADRRVGPLADGTAVDGVRRCGRRCLPARTCSSSTLTEKLLTYALGRGLQHYDMPVVRAIVRRPSADDHRSRR
jgi:hypothetical protein